MLSCFVCRLPQLADKKLKCKSMCKRFGQKSGSNKHSYKYCLKRLPWTGIRYRDN